MQAKILKLHSKTSRKLVALKKEAEQDGEYRVAKRIHAILLNNEGNTSGKIAKLLHSPRSCVSEWLKNYEIFGYEDLDFSIQRPQKILATADPKQQNRWKRYIYPHIKKKRQILVQL